MEIVTTLAEAAAFLGCSEKTVQRMLERGEMPEPLQSKKGKYTKRFWTSKQLLPLREKVKIRKSRYNR